MRSVVAGGLLLLLSTSVAVAEPGSPAQQRIAEAEQRIAARPRDTAAHRALAVAWTQRARESGESGCYERASAALARARALAPGAAEDDAVEAWIALGRHEFARAEHLAREALERRPDDVALLGLLGDARMELGRVAEAEPVYQRALALRPGPATYVRGAYYLEVTGDLEGALELLELALRATSHAEREERAWLEVLRARVEAARGAAERADAHLSAALDAFPGYHAALYERARLAWRTGAAQRAEELARAALAAAPHPERRLLLADALRELGREREARSEEQRFEREALANTAKPDNENVDLVDYYLARRPDPARALAIARREAAQRRDPRTLAALARALHANDLREEARRLADQVLASGTRDAELLREVERIRNG